MRDFVFGMAGPRPIRSSWGRDRGTFGGGAGLPVASTPPSSIVLDANTAYYTPPGSYYIARDNVSSGTLVRNVDFTETLTVYPLIFQEGTLIQWSWPGGGWPQAPSFPEMAFGNNHQNISPPAKMVKDFATLLAQIAYTEGGPDSTYNPLMEMWLSPDAAWTTSSFEVELQLDQTLKGNTPYALPINHHMTVPFAADIILKPNSPTPTTQVLIFPTQTYGTNLISNVTLSGSVNGTPGTDPTHANFTIGNLGLTKSIIGSGNTTASDGTPINYVDVRYNGTTGTTGNMQAQVLGFGVSGGLQAATPAQGLTTKCYLAIVGGSTANITSIQVQIKSYDSGFSQLAATGGGNIQSQLTATPQSFAASTTTPASTAWANGPSVFIGANTGQAVDITLRIGTPFFGTGGFAVLNNTTVDWKAIYTDLTAAGVITGNEYAHGFEIGPEVYSGAGSFLINTFNVTWA